MGTKTTERAKVLSSQVVYRGSIFDVRRDKVREPGGIVATRDVVVHFGSIVLVPVLDDGRILLVRQYRHATGESLWELVAGRTERGENPARAARRELVEETGYTGRRFRRLIEFFPTPGFVSERMVLFLVEGLKPGTARPEDDERIEVGAFSLAELERRIRHGSIRDGKTIAGLLYYSRFVAGARPSRGKR
ncbi:MAG: NUDIX hydrolase [Acidobacteriota bacterium]|nr:NUDIX hydrolase [Acidobacteriota bacterium]